MSLSLRKKRVALATALTGLACLAAWAAVSLSGGRFDTSPAADGSDRADFSATAAGNMGGSDAALTEVLRMGVADAQLKPIVGVRPYADLKVGEPLYTLGAPSGLDLTLADGMLSGRREEEGVRYVQTSAPISPGSSGGGLFDARGDLVGITTLTFAGKARLNQSLNFAIAAEMYWSP